MNSQTQTHYKILDRSILRSGMIGVRLQFYDSIETIVFERSENYDWTRIGISYAHKLFEKKYNRGYGTKLRVQNILNQDSRLWDLQSRTYVSMFHHLASSKKAKFQTLFKDCYNYTCWSSGLILGEYEYVAIDDMTHYNMTWFDKDSGDQKYKCVMVLENGNLYER